MAEFCTHEKHGGVCDLADEYCNLAACPYEKLQEFAPVRHGLWKPVYESEATGWNPEFAGRDPIFGYTCSECGTEAMYDCNDEHVLSAYCPHCGARMDGAE